MYPYSELPKPLHASELYLLLALSRGDSHGYPLKALIRNDSLGSIKLDDTQLYRLLTKLHDEGLIDILGHQPAGKSRTPRLHYGISAYGTIRLQEEIQRLGHMVRIAEHARITQNQTPTDVQRLLLGRAL